MRRRLKRFTPKQEFANLIKLRITFSDGSTYEGQVSNLSLNSLGVLIDHSCAKYVDTAAHATLMFHKTEIELEKIYILHVIPNEQMPIEINKEDRDKNIGLVVRTLSKNVPIEEMMRCIQNEDGNTPYDFELSHGKFTVADFYGYNGSDDILEKTNLFLSMHKSWRKKSVYQYERYRKSSMGKRVRLNCLRSNGSDEYLIFGSNDYLGLASHPEVIEATKKALDIYGLGSTGSPVSTGVSEEHIKLQNFLAKIFRKENALLFNNGYTANVGILTALCRKNDLVLYDVLSHASIQDSLKMASTNGATCIPFKHNDMEDLESKLKESREEYGGCLIVTEGIFSMDGHVAKMSEIVRLARKYNARTFLDVAHDFGLLGENGLGAAEYHGVLDEVDVIMGTFSKIAGGIGGFCCGTEATIEYLRMMARSYMFSVSIPPCVAAGVSKALQIFWEDKSLITNLRSNIQYFVNELIKIGIKLDPNHQSTICPVVIGHEEKLNIMTKVLFDHGIYVTPVLFPAVSRTQCRFRFTVTAIQDRTDLDYAILALKIAFDQANKEIDDVDRKKAA